MGWAEWGDNEEGRGEDAGTEPDGTPGPSCPRLLYSGSNSLFCPRHTLWFRRGKTVAHPTFNSRHIWISHSYTQQVQLHEWDAWTHVSKR